MKPSRLKIDFVSIWANVVMLPIGMYIAIPWVHKLGFGGKPAESVVLVFSSAAFALIANWFGGMAMHYLRRTASSMGRPPLDAEFLFYLFLDPLNCDAVVGDLEERYRLIGQKFGPRRANFWYWTQAARSVGPIVWVATRAAVKRLSGFAALVELYRRVRP